MISGRKGQISIFLCIILLSMVALAGVMVDGSRIVTGEQQVRRALASAVKSTLAEYNGKLKDEYGIFTLSSNDQSVLESRIEMYLNRNLAAIEPGQDKEEGYLDLYGFRVEDVKVTPFFNLSENPVVTNQILEYMKYRAPKAVVEGIWERLSAVREFGGMAEAYKRKIDIDKMLGKMDKYQQILKKSIDGGDGSQYWVNGFNHDVRYKLAGSIAQLHVEYNSLAASLKDIDAQMGALSGKGAEKEEEYERLAGERDEILTRMESVRTSLEALWKELYQKETYSFIVPNARASESVKKIIELAKSAREAIKDLEHYMEANVNGGTEASEVFRDTIYEDINALKNLILEGEKAEQILEDTLRNERLLSEVVQRLDSIRERLWSSDGESMPERELIEILAGGLGDYNNRIEYDYSRPLRTGGAEDPRKGVGEKVREGLQDDRSEDIDIEKAGISMDELPSRMKVNSPDFKDDGDTSGDDTRDGTGDGDSKPEKQEGKPYTHEDAVNIDMEVDFTNEDEKYSGNALGFLNLLGNALSEDLDSLRDEIYIGEYIMGTFKNSVPALTEEGALKPDMDLRFIEKSARDTFFRSEVEYILHGRSSERMNRLLTQSQILMTRFALNTLHVYTDARKKELAYGIAASVAGWWTGGAGIPVIANLIMCSWGMGEALLDLKELMEGKKVPFYKSAGDWKLDIGIAKGGGTTGSKFALSYHDYLRLFLLLEDRDKKIGRIEDLIELNMRKTDSGFRARQCNTYLRVEATVSMKYFFITGSFMPEGAKVDNGRHKFRVVLYEGY